MCDHYCTFSAHGLQYRGGQRNPSKRGASPSQAQEPPASQIQPSQQVLCNISSPHQQFLWKLWHRSPCQCSYLYTALSSPPGSSRESASLHLGSWPEAKDDFFVVVYFLLVPAVPIHWQYLAGNYEVRKKPACQSER
jgi:hypothetical protein